MQLPKVVGRSLAGVEGHIRDVGSPVGGLAAAHSYAILASGLLRHRARSVLTCVARREEDQ